MKRLLLVTLSFCLCMTPIICRAGENDVVLAPIMEQVVELTPEQRAEFVVGLIYYMGYMGETDLIQAAFGSLFPSVAASETKEAVADLAVGSNTRKNPALLRQAVVLEMDTYKEYSYTETVRLVDIKYGNDAKSVCTVSKVSVQEGNELVACLFEFAMGSQSDGGDRQIYIWDTDFACVYPDGSEGEGRPRFADKHNLSLYDGGVGSVWIAFERKAGMPIMVTFEVTNSYKFDNNASNSAKSKAWFLID